VRRNHGTGIGAGHFSRILHNHVHHNGQLGISAGGNSAVLRGNEIDHNNTAGYDPGWEAGGTKFVRSFNLTVDRNNVHDNNGPGLWTDGYNMNTIYENNRTSRNLVAGILHEISYHAVIRNNDVENDGYNISGHSSPWYGGGIVLSASSGVEVYGNTVMNCMNGIIILQGDRDTVGRNNYIHNNTIKQMTGTAAGAFFGSSYKGEAAECNNRFESNTYELGSNAGNFFECLNGPCTLAKWKQLGND
jgi:parallel beta-helix repeat protein